MITRRGLIKVLSGLIAAPAVVKADNLMKIVMPERSFIMIPTPEIVVRNSGISLSAIRELLMPGLRDVERQYVMVPDIYALALSEPPE